MRSARHNLQHATQQLLNEKLSHDERQLLEEKIAGLRKIASKDLSSATSISDAIKLFKIFVKENDLSSP